MSSKLHRSWCERAAADPKRIALADVGDARIGEAAARLADEALVEPVSLEEAVHEPSEAVLEAAERLEGRADLGDPLHVAALMAAVGEVDAVVAGATRPTADVLRAAIGFLGVAPGVDVISSSFLFSLPDETTIVYGDCGVLPDPNSAQLASIAVSSARTFTALTGEEARVALLSFSTHGSADHSRVRKVRDATHLARSLAPDLIIDGELQFDAAWVPAIAESKAPTSPVAGRANVFVFPDLDSGNIAYKITERLGGARAYGPLLQGVDGVMHDLSRGASVDDVVTVAVIAALQAQERQVRRDGGTTAGA